MISALFYMQPSSGQLRLWQVQDVHSFIEISVICELLNDFCPGINSASSNQARLQTSRNALASLTSLTLFLVSPDKIDIKKTLNWYSLLVGEPGLVDRVLALHAGSRGFDSHRGHMSERFFRSNRQGYPHPVSSELENSARETLQTQRGRTHGAGCVRQGFRTAEPLGERHWIGTHTHTNTHTHTHTTHTHTHTHTHTRARAFSFNSHTTRLESVV